VREALADTNLFIRWIVRDDEKQTAAVDRVLSKVASGALQLHITAVTVAEIAWVLESFYVAPKKKIRDFILAILDTPGILLEEPELSREALILFAEKNIDFADAYYIAWTKASGLNEIYTFDKRHFSRTDGINVIVPS
jgi:predicted nucleic-acid-binding protein